MSGSARVPTSPVMASIAVGGAVLLHLGLLAWPGLSAPVLVAGGSGASVAVQGTAFADLTQGLTQSVTAHTASAVTPAVADQPVKAPAVPTEATVTETIPIPATPTEPLPAVSTTAPETVFASIPVTSARPNARPAAVERKAKAQSAPRRAQTQPAPAASSPQPRGNAPANARRGTAGGAETGRAMSSGTGRSQAAGNAAASNYPGLIRQRIASQRLPRVRAAGVAQVSFGLTTNGRLATLSLAASSGSPQLDREALNLIRRSVPFPPPPPGAKRSFVVPVRAR